MSAGLLLWALPGRLTCGALCGEGAKAFLSLKPIEEESVLAARIQACDGGPALWARHW